MKSTKPFLSVIVPVYNENRRLYNLAAFHQFLCSQRKTCELIVVNDGSADNTLKKLRQLKKELDFKLITYPLNHGKGYAIKQGMLAASGQYRLFSDVDLSTPLTEFEKFLPFLLKYDLIIATRKTKNSLLLVRQPKIRETLGKGFTFLSRKMLGVKVSDFTCGFKCFSQKAADEIFPRVTIDRWGFDSEVMFLAHKLHLKHKEVNVVWKNDPLTKVKFPQDIIRSLSDLLKIRRNDFRGVYNKAEAVATEKELLPMGQLQEVKS